jgi:hypothetical protein
MIAVVIPYPWPRKTTTRRNKAVDPALWALMPSDVEGSELREELQLAIRKVVVDPPGHCPPVGALGISVGKPRYDHCGQRAHAAASVAPIPDVAGIVSLFDAQLRRCALPKAFTAGARYAERIASRPNAACKGSSNSLQRRRPAAIAKSGSSGIFGIPCKSAISLCRKSRMKKDEDRRTRPSRSRLRTDKGLRMGTEV